MRIPTSTIVMGVVTAVPFAIAIAQGRPQRDREPTYDEEVIRAERAITEEAQRAERERLEQQAARDAIELHRLYGSVPATPGPLFAGIAFGQPEPAGAHDRLAEFRLAKVELVGDEGGIYQIRVSLPTREACKRFDQGLGETWGGQETWNNDGNRAVFDTTSSGCVLVFDRYAQIEQWIDRSEASLVPVWAIGKRADVLSRRVPSSAEAIDGTLVWSEPGLGISRTEIEATLRRGIVTGIRASGGMDGVTRQRVVGRITELYGEPIPTTSERAAVRWPSATPPIALARTEDGYALTAGAVK